MHKFTSSKEEYSKYDIVFFVFYLKTTHANQSNIPMHVCLSKITLSPSLNTFWLLIPVLQYSINQTEFSQICGIIL